MEIKEAHDHSVHEELLCHFPYSVFSVALSLVMASVLMYFSFGATENVVRDGSHVLFHSCHFLHIVFAATGTTLTFFRYSKNIVRGFVVGAISAIFFCVLSDSLLPYIAGTILGVPMELHICFISEFHNVIPFLFIGLINGKILSSHKHGNKEHYSLWSHFAHIFISSLASTLYLVSRGFYDWYEYMGVVFCFLVIAVMIPCSLSDIVVPLYFAKRGKK